MEDNLAIRTRILRSPHDLAAWEEAWSQTPVPSPFASWTFVSEWLRQARGTEPFIVLFTDPHDTLVAIAPWSIVRSKARVLTGIGGDDAWFHDPLILRSEWGYAVSLRLVDLLRRERQAWDLLRLSLRPDLSAPLLKGLERLGWVLQVEPAWCQHAVVEFDGDWQAYWKPRERGFEGNVRKLKKLSRLPHRFFQGDMQTCAPLLEAMFHWHSNRLSQTRDWRPYYDFLRAYVPRALPRGMVSLNALEVEGMLAAVDLSWRTSERVYGAMRAYHPDFASLNVGFALTVWMFERFCAEGIRQVDCGAGLHEWKRRFQTGTVRSIRVQAPSSLWGVAHLEWGTLAKEWLRGFPLAVSLHEGLKQRGALQRTSARAT